MPEPKPDHYATTVAILAEDNDGAPGWQRRLRSQHAIAYGLLAVADELQPMLRQLAHATDHDRDECDRATADLDATRSALKDARDEIARMSETVRELLAATTGEQVHRPWRPAPGTRWRDRDNETWTASDDGRIVNDEIGTVATTAYGLYTWGPFWPVADQAATPGGAE